MQGITGIGEKHPLQADNNTRENVPNIIFFILCLNDRLFGIYRRIKDPIVRMVLKTEWQEW
ncbi:hypothetical protein C7N83_04915 [Neisseria iguanae]|uniref:Uncharacterized protein n=1 Tax=Neisseria iguanae TaxID=90242 RepID=A0A2P7U0W0_9NEIS|nr:hypothetical protein C7N83_04915 [Neisseria iguanae]